MSQVIILVDDPADWAAYYPTRHLLSARDYLQAAQPVCTDKKVQVINLCRSYKYLSPGYYCSLLAEARGQRVLRRLAGALATDDTQRVVIHGPGFVASRDTGGSVAQAARVSDFLAAHGVAEERIEIRAGERSDDASGRTIEVTVQPGGLLDQFSEGR